MLSVLIGALIGGAMTAALAVGLPGPLARLGRMVGGTGPGPGLPPVGRAGDLTPPLRTSAAPPDAADVRASASRFLDVLVDALAAPIVILDRHFAISHANAGGHALLGESASAVLRHPSIRNAAEGLSTASVTEVEIALDVPVARRLRASLMRLPAPFAGEGLLSVVLDDRTQNFALERMRADFVANASHELRTPLAPLIGFIDTLRGPAADDPAAQQQFLEIMSGQAHRMRRLIDNLMSLSRVQLIEHQRPRGHIDLAALASRVVAELRPLFEARRQTLSLVIAPALQPVVADADQIAQVLQNLMDNAGKYSPDGASVMLSLRDAPTSGLSLEDPLWSPSAGVILSIADDGPGIEARHIARLTERFYRVEESHSGKPGSGLGLAIVKHIVGRHRGKLAIDSKPGQGTTFHVWLPVA